MRHELTEAEDGTVVSARIGDEVDLRLPGMPSGGYRWLPDNSSAALFEPLAQGSAFEQGSVGGLNETRFRFRIKAAGRGTLRLRYARSWEAGEPPLKTFGLTVDSSDQ